MELAFRHKYHLHCVERRGVAWVSAWMRPTTIFTINLFNLEEPIQIQYHPNCRGTVTLSCSVGMLNCVYCGKCCTKTHPPVNDLTCMRHKGNSVSYIHTWCVGDLFEGVRSNMSKGQEVPTWKLCVQCHRLSCDLMWSWPGLTHGKDTPIHDL